MHVKMGIRDRVRRGKGVCAPGWKRSKSVGGSLWAEAYTLIRRGVCTLYLSSAFLLRHFLHITDVISFVISIILTT